MKKYLYNNLLLIFYFIIHSFLIILLEKLNVKPNYTILSALFIIVFNCILQSKQELIFNLKSIQLYYLIISIINSAISSLVIFVIRVIGSLIACKGINQAFLMDLSWFSLFLLGGFLMIFLFNYISYVFLFFIKKKITN